MEYIEICKDCPYCMTNYCDHCEYYAYWGNNEDYANNFEKF